MKFLNKTSLTVALIFLLQTSVQGDDKWSKQILSHEAPTAEDWVPIRQGKTISFERDLQPAAQSQLQYFAEPLNQNRFRAAASPSEINNFAIPPNNPFQFFNSAPQSAPKTRTIQNFGGPLSGQLPQAEALVQQSPNFQYMQEIRNGPNVVHYQSQPIPKSLSGFSQSQQLNNFPQRPPPQFQKIPPPQFQPVQGPPQFQPIPNDQPPQIPQQQPNNGDVQLLYVPFNSLYPQDDQQQRPGQSRFNVLNQPVSAALINDFYSQNEVQEIPAKQTTRRPTVAPVTSNLKSNPFESHSKPKPHQPPLSMFVKIEGGRASESDVLKTLQNSNTIDVMDTYSKSSPNVFIGPSGMVAPEGYTKFELPYLSNIENTRTERKIEQLPFFVAPLSYKTPPGFSKIPLPAPHVGSVVVNQPNSLQTEVTGFTKDNYFTKKPSPSTVQQFSSPTTADKQQRVVLNSGFKLGSDGNVDFIRNEFTFPTLQPSRPSPTFEAQRSVFTTPRSTFAASTAETPLTKVAYKEIEEKRNYGHSTLVNPSTTRAPVTQQRTKSENYYATSPRSTARQQPPKTTQSPSNLNEDYFSFDNSKRPISQFSFGTEVENPTHNFDFRPIPNNFNFGEVRGDFATTKKPTKTKASTSQFNFPSSTPLPSPSFSFSPTVSVIENTDAFGLNGGSDGNFFEFRSTNRPSQDFSNANRFNFGTEQTYTPSPQQYTIDSNNNNENTADDSIVTTENPNYSLPSDLPEISPQLPGWINSLMDDKWMNENNLTEQSTAQPTTTTTTTTRRPSRGSRRPVSSASSSSSRVSETSSTSAERRPVTTSRRRPTSFPSRNSVSPTEVSTPVRSTLSSRGTKVRYNGTSDEKSRFRTRGRGGAKGTEEDNIAYQRDVLNQNYPSSIRPPLAGEPVTERFVNSVSDADAYKVETSEVSAESPSSVNDYNQVLENVEVIPLGGNNDNSINENTPDHSPLYYENTIDTTTTSTTTTTTTTYSPPPTLPSNHKYFNDIQEQQQQPRKQHKNVATANRLRGNFNYNKNRNSETLYNTRDQQTTTTHQPEFEDDETYVTVPTTQAPTTTTLAPTTTEATESPIPRRTNFPRRRLTYTTTESPQTEGNSDSVRFIIIYYIS